MFREDDPLWIGPRRYLLAAWLELVAAVLPAPLAAWLAGFLLVTGLSY